MMLKYIFVIVGALLFVTVLKAQQEMEVVSEVLLSSDGEGGVETYKLIESKFGVGCIEAPDLYNVNHPEVKHIVETSDEWIGDHFVFKIHKNDDWDRDTGKTDRQRNEIKTYANSANTVKGFRGETLRFHWYFKLQEGFTISRNFSHFFQFKAVGGNDSSQPIVTISGSINSGNPEFEIIYNSGNGAADKQLIRTDWSKANTGEWMEIEALARFDDEGFLKITIKDLWGNEILSVEKESIDLWRTGSSFVRPKWGIYRSLKSKSELSDDEETAGFANFSIQKLDFVEQTDNRKQGYKSFEVYPNPAKDYISIAIQSNRTERIELRTVEGRLLKVLTLQNMGSQLVDVSDLSAGQYILTSVYENSTVLFMKE